jgi:putative ABC transport system permease protein
MLKSYFTIAVRNLWRNRSFSLLNIAGLTIGISVFLLILEYTRSEKNSNRFHKNYNNLYRISVSQPKEAVVSNYIAPGYAPLLKKSISGIDEYIRIAEGLGAGVMHKSGNDASNNSFREEDIIYADDHFFEVFSFSLIDGNGALEQPKTMAIAESIAQKLFKRTNVIGERVTINNQFGETDYSITGVFKDIPTSSDIRTSVILSINTLSSAQNRDGNDWADPATLESGFVNLYLKLNGAVTGATVAKSITDLYRKTKTGEEQTEVLLQPFKYLHLAPSLDYPLQTYGSLGFVWAMGAVAALILIIGWINYINLSTALALKRAKETGIRKVLGANKWQLIVHYLTETLVITLCCSLLSVLIVQIVQPLFNGITGKTLSLSIFLQDFSWVTAVLIIILGALLAGGYVAFTLSRFKPIDVLHGRKLGISGGNGIRKILVVFQFTVSVLLIVGTIVVIKQLSFMKSENKGLNMKQLLVIKGPTIASDDQAQRNSDFKNTLGTLPYVSKYAASNNVPGRGYNFNTDGITSLNPIKGDEKKNYAMFITDQRYFDTYGITLLQGRSYTPDEADAGWRNTKKVLLNETAAKQMGFNTKENIVGKKILWGDEYEIIGLVKDYHHLSLRQPIDPVIFLPSVSFGYFSLQISTSDLQTKIANLKNIYQARFPGNPFEYFFADENYNSQYLTEQNLGRVFIAAALIAIFIACMGLFGLTAFATQQRNKEIGIRKVLGADSSQLVLMLSGDFMKLVMIAMTIAIPLSWWMMQQWLEDFAYRTSMPAWVFILAGLIAFSIAFITVSTQALKAAMANPVKSLRTE